MNMTNFYVSTAVVAEKGIDFLEGLNLWRLNYEGSGEVGGVKFSHDDMGDCYLYMNEEDETFGLLDTYE